MQRIFLKFGGRIFVEAMVCPLRQLRGQEIRNLEGTMIQLYFQIYNWRDFDIHLKQDSPAIYLLQKYNTLMKACVIFYRILDLHYC